MPSKKMANVALPSKQIENGALPSKLMEAVVHSHHLTQSKKPSLTSIDVLLQPPLPEWSKT